MRKRDNGMHVHFVVTMGSLAIVFLLGIFLGNYIAMPKADLTSAQQTPNTEDTAIYQTSGFLSDMKNGTTVTVLVPAVDDQGGGIITFLDVQVTKGTGKILTNIDKLLFWVDTQNSIRTATKVAEEISKKQLSDYDIVYTVRANASVIEGGSAGAALTVATIAALENKTLNTSIVMTGTINADGKIGPIGEVVAKALAAKDFGAKLFLAPVGQGSSTIYTPERKCYTEESVQVCETKTVGEKISISKDIGLEVKEVATVQDALKYFLVE